MIDREKVISTFEKIINVCKEDGCDFVDLTFEDAEQIFALLKEQEEREKRICKNICDFIRGACSTDTDDDKDFVCYEIQKCFTEGR